MSAPSALSTRTWTSYTNNIYTVSGGQVYSSGWNSGRTTRLYTQSRRILRYNFPCGFLYRRLATIWTSLSHSNRCISTFSSTVPYSR